MAQGIPRIKEFPRDGRYWRVDWFGALESDPGVVIKLKVSASQKRIFDRNQFMCGFTSVNESI